MLTILFVEDKKKVVQEVAIEKFVYMPKKNLLKVVNRIKIWLLRERRRLRLRLLRLRRLLRHRRHAGGMQLRKVQRVWDAIVAIRQLHGRRVMHRRAAVAAAVTSDEKMRDAQAATRRKPIDSGDNKMANFRIDAAAAKICAQKSAHEMVGTHKQTAMNMFFFLHNARANTK